MNYDGLFLNGATESHAKNKCLYREIVEVYHITESELDTYVI